MSTIKLITTLTIKPAVDTEIKLRKYNTRVKTVNPPGTKKSAKTTRGDKKIHHADKLNPKNTFNPEKSAKPHDI